MRSSISLIAFLIFSLQLSAQELIQVNAFMDTKAFKQRTPSVENATLEIKEVSDQHILFKRFIDPETGEKDKSLNYAWAIEYQGNYYFNLAYSFDHNELRIFLKLDLLGPNFALTAINTDAHSRVKSKVPTAADYGRGIQGILSAYLENEGSVWKNAQGERVRFLLIDLNRYWPANKKITQSSKGIVISYNDFAKIFLLDDRKRTKALTAEKLVQIVEYRNQ